MPREAQDVTESELAVMHRLWEARRASIRQLTDVLYPQGSAAQYATVQKQLERLEAKGFVRRDRSLFVHVFEPAVDRDELIGRRIRSMAEKLCGGSMAPILSHLARSKALTVKERRALRELMEWPDDERREGRTDTEGGSRKG